MVADRCPNAVRCADPFHVVQVGHRRPRRGPPPGLERRPRRPGGRSNRIRWSADAPPSAAGTAQGAQARPLRAVEEPREPHRPAAGQAGLDRQDRPPAAPRLPAQGRPAAGLPARLRRSRRAPSDRGSAGPAAAASRPSSTCSAASSNTGHSILAAIEHGLSNGRIESVNTKIRLITRDRLRIPLTPTPSSPWPCSTSAATDPPSPAGHDPRISQESRLSAACRPRSEALR